MYTATLTERGRAIAAEHVQTESQMDLGRYTNGAQLADLRTTNKARWTLGNEALLRLAEGLITAQGETPYDAYADFSAQMVRYYDRDTTHAVVRPIWKQLLEEGLIELRPA